MTDQLKCDQCGVTTTKNGQPFKNISALNTHRNVHCPNKESATSGGSEDHTHKWQLLKPISAAHTKAMAAGYTKICECGEIE